MTKRHFPQLTDFAGRIPFQVHLSFTMTTTSTYQGLGEDSKTASRVLRPPGGQSSNIFGAEGVQRTPNRPQTNDIFGTGPVEPTEEYKGKRRGGPTDNSRDNVFGGSTTSDNSLYTRSENKRRGQDPGRNRSEEFPVYDRSVYAAQRDPQRRNIKQVSTYNPITGQMYAGFEDMKDENPVKGKRSHPSNMGAYNPITGEPVATSPPKPDREEEEWRREPQQNYEGEKRDIQQSTHTSSRVLAPPGGKSSGPLW
ncbi:jupiter microtubule associated homolog 2-like isoform X2 [Ostrea edulis]|uniref:jupiter microtubule associated homolog 2-like isoform X2 n=1 Tax=Ostrea edulis TaxID=37623 RepID=UPI002095C1F1|nr:jupiter microtubule associated homolog 2-like isoform X2 [Ostrea edulis]